MSERTLYLRFILDEHDVLSPSDFADFFEYGSAVVRELAVVEWRNLVRELQLKRLVASNVLAATEEQILRSTTATAPAEVLEVKHDSPWQYLLAIPSSLLAYFLVACVRPEVKRAWQGSRARQELYSFLRERLFRGSVETIKSPRGGAKRPAGIRIKKVTEVSKRSSELPIITFLLAKEPMKLLQLSDEELMAEIRKQIARKG